MLCWEDVVNMDPVWHEMKSSHIYILFIVTLAICKRLKKKATTITATAAATKPTITKKPHKNPLTFYSKNTPFIFSFVSRLLSRCEAIVYVRCSLLNDTTFLFYFWVRLWFLHFCASHIKYAIDRRSVELLQIICPHTHRQLNTTELLCAQPNRLKGNNVFVKSCDIRNIKEKKKHNSLLK